MDKKDLIRYISVSMLIQALFSYIFYRSGIAFFLLSPICILILKVKKRELCKKQKEELQLQFKDAVLGVSAALEAGYSPENAFKEAYYDMKLLYGAESLICKELFFIQKQLANNISLEQLLNNFGKRSDLSDIKDFAEIFHTAKRNGGDLTKIIKNTAHIISDKSEVKKELETILSAKKYEQKIMNMVPFFMITYISISSPGFFNPLYHNLIGNIIMTVCLFLYIGAFLMARKITDIHI